ncbi:hypothetical protein ACFL2C_02095 [Patescibacteria group bacterium]
MASLTKAAVVSRKTIRYGIYALIAILIIRLAFNGLVSVYKKVFPPKDPPPTVKYGTLPSIPFPVQEEVQISYELEFLNDVEKFPDQTRVYFIPKPTTNLLALDNAREKASSLGFSGNGRELVETIYSFVSTDGLSTLNINIVTGAFSIAYDTNSNPSILDSRPPNFEAAEAIVRDKLRSANLLSPDLADGTSTNQYLKKVGGGFGPAISLSEANVTKINLYRKPLGLGEIPSVSADPDQSNVWFMVAPPSTIIAAEYHYFPIDEMESATYPLKTFDQAWDDLENGKAFIASRGSNESDQVLITNAFLAYFDPSQYTEFYQPVVVFENEDGFRAYVPAVTSEFYGDTNDDVSSE